MIGVDVEEHPVGVGVWRDRFFGADVEVDVFGVVAHLGGGEIVAGGGVGVAGFGVEAFGVAVDGVIEGVAVFGLDVAPVFEMAVDGDWLG